MAEDLTSLSEAEIRGRVEAVRERMRPLEQELAGLRGDRDVLLTELRRRQRMARVEDRAAVKAAVREGRLATIAEVISGGGEGSFEGYRYNLKTGGQVRLGFPGAKAQTVAFTDGRQVVQAKDLAEASRLYEAGWELGGPGRPGVRVHFPGTRQERLAEPSEVYVSVL